MTSQRKTPGIVPELVAQVIGVIADLLPFGAVLTDREGRLHYTNPAARDIADRRDGLRLSG